MLFSLWPPLIDSRGCWIPVYPFPHPTPTGSRVLDSVPTRALGVATAVRRGVMLSAIGLSCAPVMPYYFIGRRAYRIMGIRSITYRGKGSGSPSRLCCLYLKGADSVVVDDSVDSVDASSSQVLLKNSRAFRPCLLLSYPIHSISAESRWLHT